MGASAAGGEDQAAPGSSFSMFSGYSSKPKSASESRDERYCNYLVNLNRVLEDWEKGALRTQEALMHADYFMEKIQEVGRVDAGRARVILSKKGIGDEKRLTLQQTYQKLKRAVGQRVPQFDDKGNHRQDSHWLKQACC